MKPNPVTWFEIPAADLDRARKFYEAVFEIEMQPFDLGEGRMAWFPMEKGLAGSTGCLMQAESYVPSHDGSMVYFAVDSIEEILSRVEVQGGSVLNPKTGIGEFGFVAHFEDCEGNRVALHADS